jgi:hypothetical protein
MSAPNLDAIKAAFDRVTAPDSKVDNEWVVTPTPFSSHEENQFLFFLKPEATTANMKYILDLSVKVLAGAGVTFGAIRIVGGPYLDKHNIMVQHYGVISKISKEGYDIISDAAKAKLHADFKDDVAAVGLPLGGHQWLKKNPDFSPLALCTINDNIRPTRLAGGTYLCKFQLLGKTQLVLNPFHAYQLVPYVKQGNALIVFECRSKMSWEELRTNLCGTTDPSKAVDGSIRNGLLKNKEATGMVAVNLGSNGVHMSAGPLEGMVELQRFLSDWDAGKKVEFTSLAFGAHLASLGVSAEKINKLADNPNIKTGDTSESTFDMTEEKSATEAGPILAEAAKTL